MTDAAADSGADDHPEHARRPQPRPRPGPGRRPSVFLIGEDLADPGGGISQVTKGLSTAYGTDRVRDTPISEAAIVGAAVGAAMAGLRPVAEVMIMDFISIALDQLVNHAAKARFMSGGRLRYPAHRAHGGVRGDRLGRHPLPDPGGWLAHIPGLKVVVPSTPGRRQGTPDLVHLR